MRLMAPEAVRCGISGDFEALGFMIEEFGGSEYAIRGVPMDLYGYGCKDFFQEILDELEGESVSGTPEGVRIPVHICSWL